MLAPTGRSRILQIHPTRRCNLRCLHCYSLSGPDKREELSEELLCSAIEDASAEGYTIVSVSGGEPLLYEPLRPVLDKARQCGMGTTITSNGMLLDEKRLERLQGGLDLLAISLDGIPSSHDKMRNSPVAFKTMERCLQNVRRSGIPFGFIFTLTQHNLRELPWVAEFTLNQGAQLLQIHPLEEVGRASECLNGSSPDTDESTYAFLAAAQLDAQYRGRLKIQLDLVSQNMLAKDPERYFAGQRDGWENEPLSELVSPLIIEQDGAVVPLQYGFSRDFGLGSLYDAPLGSLAKQWKAKKRGLFGELCQQAHKDITSSDTRLHNWYSTMSQLGILAAS
jgi:MoaA/NifB/PqqE/SkfB family radical SAM enzyme